VDRPLTVPLGTHRFGHPRPPDAIVAHAGPDQIGFDEIVQEGVGIGPQSFDIARDGSVWLLDGVNGRLLVWRPGRPDRPARTVRVPRLVFGDFTLAPDGTIYLIGALQAEPGPRPSTCTRWPPAGSSAGPRPPSSTSSRTSSASAPTAWSTVLPAGRP
jgi:hypothetical protein